MVDYKQQLEELKDRLTEVQNKLNSKDRLRQIQDIETKSISPDFWSDSGSAQSEMKRLAVLQKQDQEIAELEKDLNDAISVAEIIEEKDIKKLTKK